MKWDKIGLGGRGQKKNTKNIGHHLCTFPYRKYYSTKLRINDN